MRLLFKIVTCILLCSCKIEGTDTGNPGFNYDNPSTPVGNEELFPTEIYELTITICSPLSPCEGEVIDGCFDSVFEMDNINMEVGLRPGAFKTLREIHIAVVNKVLEPDIVAYEHCSLQIEAMACTDGKVKNAYNKNHPRPFLGVAKMLPRACRHIF